MKTDSISLGPDLAKELKGCKVGETKDITLRITVDNMDNGLTGTVESIVDYEDPTDDSGEAGGEPAPKPKGPKPPPKKAAALAEAMGGEDY